MSCQDVVKHGLSLLSVDPGLVTYACWLILYFRRSDS